MPLPKGQLKSDIAAAFITAMQTEDAEVTSVANQLATDISDAIDSYVKAGTVSTVVTGTLPTGPTAASGTGSIS